MQTHEEKFLRPDSKGRLYLGELAKGVSSYKVTVDESSRIILEPYAEIPLRERWLYENKEALEDVLIGLEQSASGQVHSIGYFEKYLKDD
jgi:hypothetical protein